MAIFDQKTGRSSISNASPIAAATPGEEHASTANDGLPAFNGENVQAGHNSGNKSPNNQLISSKGFEMNNPNANYGSPHVDFDLDHNKNMFNTIQRGRQEIVDDKNHPERDTYITNEEYKNQ